MSTLAQTQPQNVGRVASILQSYKGLPSWVKIWMNLLLGPVNLATLAFLDQPSGGMIAALSLSGMFLTVAMVLVTGGFHKITAAGHVLPWIPLVLMLAFARPEGAALYQNFLTLLLVVNVISLAFDLNALRQLATRNPNPST